VSVGDDGRFHHPHRRRPAISAKIFVGNLSYQTTKEELTQLLSGAGSVVNASLPTDRETGRPRGFAFVEFASDEQAAEAIRLFNGRELGGRKLNVNAADERPRRTDGGGPRPYRPAPPMMFSRDDPGSGGGGGGFGDRGAPKDKRFRSKGSRRGLRRRKRSL
jgi:cold-inducible RNA-binding protein